MDLSDALSNLLLDFTFYYPFFMAYLWMIGGITYRLGWEARDHRAPDDPPRREYEPSVSLLVPCHNEGDNARETIAALLAQDYANFEVIAINDGSRDNTGQILDELAARHERLRVIHLASNQGKAMALKTAALLSNSEYFVCVDGDALLDRHATRWMVRHLIDHPEVGAVTGNPRIRNRTTLLGKIQVGEFSSIIGLIKRAQSVYGRIFTVSGVIVAFRKSALHEIGYWNTDMVTEDIDVSWRLQLAHYRIVYEPNALCWILMPETLTGLWRQRLRWAQGGAEVFLRYGRRLFSWEARRMWPVMLEYVASVLWSYLMLLIFVSWALGQAGAPTQDFFIRSVLPGWAGVLLIITSLFQFTVSLTIDGRYEKGLKSYYFWMIWYPILYWVLNMATTVGGFPKALFKKRGKRAVWVSPDRGVH